MFLSRFVKRVLLYYGRVLLYFGRYTKGVPFFNGRYTKEVPFVNVRYTKGVSFLPKMVYKRVRGWMLGQSLPVLTFS